VIFQLVLSHQSKRAMMPLRNSSLTIKTN